MVRYHETIIPVPKHTKAGTLKGKIPHGGTDQAAGTHQVLQVFQILETALLQ